MTFDLAGKKIYVAGHRGMVGSALLRRFERDGIDCLTARRGDVDLRDQASVRAFMGRERPEVIVIAAAKVGGIHANDTQPADFIYDNIMIEANLIEAAHRTDVEKLVLLGSSCIYPRLAPQPMNEDLLLTGPLEPTNEWYAVAKIAGRYEPQQVLSYRVLATRRNHTCWEDATNAAPGNGVTRGRKRNWRAAAVCYASGARV